MRILLELSYDGSRYHGWQKQPDCETVQGKLEQAIEAVLCEHSDTFGCSRTDAGVHAKSFFCHFDTGKPFDWSRLPDALNANLPKDICVLDAKKVSDEFHSRFDVKSKTYEYLIWNSRRRNALYADRALHWYYPIDEKTLNRAACGFVGTHDFCAFMAQGSSALTTERTVYSAEVERDGDFVKFRVCGNGFLYNMVRIMTGTLLYVSQGKLLYDDIPKIIESKDRKKAGPTAEPQGLYLVKVEY